ncbi:hypothetical protein [[Acholeplasma] multilocale]|uniref:hypothetical protein n=1 Tax=[Acholeplasma] multilocale TaxID=264638 RepID=UPI000478D51E|nr:hypothetical protein [[Acholeplasma] multilocale]
MKRNKINENQKNFRIKNIKDVKLWIFFFTALLVASVLIIVAIKLINAAVNMPNGIEEGFFLGPAGKIIISWDKYMDFYNSLVGGVSSKTSLAIDMVANIYLLIILPLTVFIIAILFSFRNIKLNTTDDHSNKDSKEQIA